MNFKLMPFDQILSEINNEANPSIAFDNIVKYANNVFPSQIWDSFKIMNLSEDIADATVWLQETIDEFPGATGIYLGLDTLNMDDGEGSNVEIGLSSECDPHVFNDEWTYGCDNYGKSYLIRGLSLVSDSFINESLWKDDERSFSEYVIFLAYSGIVLREALLELNIENDFISIWGFHDGDMFYLVNKIDGKKSLIATVEM